MTTIAAALLLTACTGQSQQSASTEQTAEPTTAAPAATLKYHDAVAIDMATGAVKSIDYAYGNDDDDDEYVGNITYDRDGACTAPHISNIKRDDQGYPISYRSGDSDDTHTIEVQYDDQHRVTTLIVSNDFETETHTFTRDAQGRIIQETEKEVDNDTHHIDTDITRYEYLSTDPQGNWTKRKCTDDDGDTMIERRRITYWNK